MDQYVVVNDEGIIERVVRSSVQDAQAEVRFINGANPPSPWRVMPMLEDCLRLGLLRTVGPVYQFRHAALQDHLARRPPAPSP